MNNKGNQSKLVRSINTLIIISFTCIGIRLININFIFLLKHFINYKKWQIKKG